MGITVLNDVFLSDDAISAGLRGKNMRMNSRIGQNGGFLTSNVIWTRTLRQFELGFIPMSLTAWTAIEALHEITEGGAYGFLMEDPTGCTVSSGALTEVSAGVYQLQKRYIDAGSSRFKDRKITRPRAVGFQIFESGIPIGGGSFTLDDDTGLVTIPSLPDEDDLSWSGRFYVPVHFMEDNIDWEVVRPGSDATMLVSGPSIMLQEIRE
jgi:uncharacterized protein (TIGR02217 family)